MHDGTGECETQPAQAAQSARARASEREEMLAGKLYNSVDPELNALREKVAHWLQGETLHGSIWRAGLPRTMLQREEAAA